MRFHRPLLLGVVLAAACHSATPAAAAPEKPVLMRRTSDTSTVYTVSRANTTGSTTPYFEFQVDKQAEYVGGTSVSPHPVNGQVSSRALVQFVVDTAGTVRPGTFKVLRMKDATLIDDARKVLAQWKYTPAEVGGRKVSQLVQVEIER